jgi:molybdenum cofactor cytidylyltransferase
MSEIWAIILAAGESKRMGSPKMILPFWGSTIIEKVIENVLSSNVDKTVLVVGSGKNKILKLTEKFPVMHCYNEHYKDGMLSSAKCGFKYLPHDFRAAMVFLGDQPTIKASITDFVIKSYNDFGKGLVLPVYNKKRGHPLLVDSKYKGEIMELEGPEGLKELLKRHPDDVLEIETQDPSILKDIDTEEDYMNELNQKP